MQKITQKQWVPLLREGDIGLTYAPSWIATIQKWFEKKESQSKHIATHSFASRGGDKIIEANAVMVGTKNKITKYFEKGRTIWIFRRVQLKPLELKLMRTYLAGIEDAGGIYSWESIFEFIKKYTVGAVIKDRRGVNCGELTSRQIENGELPYMNRKAFKITPSQQLTWFLEEGQKQGWKLALYYKNGQFYST